MNKPVLTVDGYDTAETRVVSESVLLKQRFLVSRFMTQVCTISSKSGTLNVHVSAVCIRMGAEGV